MTIFILLILIIIIFIIGYYYIKKEPFQTLRNPSHLAATVFRSTNTILTSPNTFDESIDKLVLPEQVNDSFNEWIDKGFISPVKDQMLCGGCWAFATCGTLADRLTIATNGAWYSPFGLSEQVLISCGGEMGMDFYQGCDGGIPHFAIDALTKEGVPEDYSLYDNISTTIVGNGGQTNPQGVVNPGSRNNCATSNEYAVTNYTWWQTGCDGNTSCLITPASTCPCSEIIDKFKQVVGSKESIRYKTLKEAHNYTSHGLNDEIHTVDLWPDIPDEIIKKNVLRMKKAIYFEGPITVGYRVTSDFYNYWPTVSADNYYQYDGKSPMTGGHAVVIVGWKKMDDGTPVWIVKNSWGSNGGYGFPNGPKWTNPITGKYEPKYLGGFWNHKMGDNDSFIESNASGCYPDILNPEIAKYLPNSGKELTDKWYETFTLRDIYKMSSSGTLPPTPSQPTPSQPPIKPQPQKISSEKYKLVILTPDDITSASVELFFNKKSSLFMLGANNVDTAKKVLDYLPSGKTLSSSSDIQKLSQNLHQNLNDYIIVAGKEWTNTFFNMSGNPIDWNMNMDNHIDRSATVKKLVADIYPKFITLNPSAIILQIESKS